MKELEKHYDARTVEARWYGWWQEKGCFHSEASRGGTPYCVVIPPPNVTGILHMGHALNNTIQDILVRWHRMQGFNTVWMPGTDHAGIATQNVVERALRKEGRTRHDLGREAFVEKVWEWKQEYGGTIVRQLKSLGASCDWERERFTMDAGLSEAVAEVFCRLYEKGLIYRANYITNWCPRCHTALSDEESEHQDTAGKLYHIRYPLKRDGRLTASEFVVVATTRPETLLGDVAVAVNPKDERYRTLVGKTLSLPLLHRELPLLADEFVDPAFGTGAVKVTPAHDPNDFEMGRRHNLVPVNVMNPDGTMNEAAGPYAGLDRFECRKRIITDLTAAGLIEKIDNHQHAVGHCYRCDTVVEPRLSLQWFVRMKPLAEPALQAVMEGRIRFIPERWNKVYVEWMSNIRDWCISRQIWWGHRIPVFYCDACGHQWAARGKPAHCPACQATTFRQDEDVLDTWFSSWLWPFSTFGWPGKSADLSFYYPGNTLVTASEIIFFWVARMIMAGLEFMGEIPFREVYIHGTVRDDKGRKMSKSLGNSIDPLTIINEFSTDALRYSLMMITATGQDVFLSNDKFEIGRNFATKIWNAARYLQMQEGADARKGGPRCPSAADLTPALLRADDLHILYALDQAARSCSENLARFRFNDAARDLYEFIWHQFCDWYVEYSKDVLYGQDAARRGEVLRVMHFVFSNALRLLHPFMPHLTEELWHGMGYAGDEETIMTAPWPARLESELSRWGASTEIARYVDDRHELIRMGRMLRVDCGIAPGQKLDYIIKPNDATTGERLTADTAALASMLKAGRISVDAVFVPPTAMPSILTPLGTLYMSIEGVIDVAAEKAKLTRQVAELEGHLERANLKLGNQAFISKAKPEVVAQFEKSRQELQERYQKTKRLLEMLG